MSAAPDYDASWPGRPQAGLTGLLEAASAAVGRLADEASLEEMTDRDAVAMMGTLTTLIGRLDGLRVQVARAVRQRDICGLRGARNLAGWLRADARRADDAWKISRLAAAGPELPQITALLDAGTISLSQAATACWQVAQLPDVPVPPTVIDSPETFDPPGPDGATPGPDGAATAGPPVCQPGSPGDGTAGPHTDDAPSGAASPGPAEVAGPSAAPGHAGLPGGGGLPTRVDPSGGEAWAGLWRAGDVHAAADALFAAFLPRLDSGQLRQLGAHLREAADAQDRAASEHDDYARRSLRISRSLHGNGEITGRLHAEAAEQVIAAFEQLGGKAGPDDTRSKAQRWPMRWPAWPSLPQISAQSLHRLPPPPRPTAPPRPGPTATARQTTTSPVPQASPPGTITPATTMAPTPGTITATRPTTSAPGTSAPDRRAAAMTSTAGPRTTATPASGTSTPTGTHTASMGCAPAVPAVPAGRSRPVTSGHGSSSPCRYPPC